MNFEEYLGLVDRARRENPHWRHGQTVFNILHRVRPDLSEQIRSTPIDPFYFHTYNQIHKTLTYIKENW